MPTPTGPAFTFSHSVDDVADNLDPMLAGVPDDIAKAVAGLIDQMRDRDSDVEDFLTGTLAGQKDKTTITATAGGASIVFAKSFSRTPVIHVGNPNDSGGYTASVVDASISSTSFKVQIFNGATEITSGNYKVAWIAT